MSQLSSSAFKAAATPDQVGALLLLERQVGHVRDRVGVVGEPAGRAAGRVAVDDAERRVRIVGRDRVDARR